MRLDKNALQLYAVTDRSWLRGRSFWAVLEEALAAGVTFLQLREKDVDPVTLLKLAKGARSIAERHKVPFVVNDHVDVALACNADGVHIGQGDLPAKDVRRMIGPEKILGVSAQTIEQAIQAEREGADYLGVGTIFPTSTKPDAQPVDLKTLKEICAAVSIPVVAIGGIDAENALQLKGCGLAGIAVVSAIFAQDNIREAVTKLRQVARQVVCHED
ncbi:MAG TPA: thiamine phosphate synthase [Firmicutes bacterium]|nr:thiamine phosphate synthase [Bacillota bacterium]